MTLLFSLGQRAYHWGTLILILGIILFIGLGAPFTPFAWLFSWWGHW